MSPHLPWAVFNNYWDLATVQSWLIHVNSVTRLWHYYNLLIRILGSKQSLQTNQPPNNQSQTQPKNHCRAPAASPIPKSNHSVLSSMTVKRSQAKISERVSAWEIVPKCAAVHANTSRVPCSVLPAQWFTPHTHWRGSQPKASSNETGGKTKGSLTINQN